jgi:hypothetical protein
VTDPQLKEISASAVSGGVLAVQASGQGEPGASLLERQEDALLTAEVHEIPKSDAPVSVGGSLIDGRPVWD